MHYKQACLFDNFGLDLGLAQQMKLRIMNAEYAANTLRAYRFSWKAFQTWCAQTGCSSLPATPQTCIDHVSWCIAEGLRFETVSLRMRAVNHYHKRQKLPLPYDDSVREFMRNAKRVLCEKPQGKDAITPAQLRRMSKALSSVLNPVDIRDRAIILLGFASGWRESELVSLDLRDVRWIEPGLILRLGKSKTDQAGVGRIVGIHRGRRELTCPVIALKQWIATRGCWHGPLFVRLTGQHEITKNRLHPGGVRRAVKRALELIGQDSTTFGAHSLRIGMVTASAEAGATETAIMQRAG